MFRNVLYSVAALTLFFGTADSAFAQKKPVKPDQDGVAGVVKKVDDKSITIAVVTQKGQPAEEKSFVLAADAKVSVLGKQAKITEVIIDKPAHLTLNADKKVAAVSQDKLAEKVPGLSGTLKKFDEKANTITIAIVTQKGQPAEEQTFTLAANVKISVLGNAAKLSEVVADKPVQLQLDADKKVAVISQDKSANKGDKGAGGLSGTFKKFDEKANTITIAIVTQKGQPAEEQKFTLAADVKISVLGNAAKLSEVAADKPVQLRLDADKKVAAISQDKSPDKGDKGSGLSATFKKFDANANTITVAIVTQKGQPAEDQTFKVTNDVKVSVLGNAAKLSDVAADKPVQLKLDADKTVVALVQVDKTSGGINGVLKKVDDKASTVTIAVTKVKGQPAEEQTFNVIEFSKIVVSGKPAKLGELDLEKPVAFTLNADKKIDAISQGKGQKPMK